MATTRKRISIGRSQDFTIGAMHLLEVEGIEIGVTRLQNGELRAIRNRCPHKAAPVCRGRIGGVWDSMGPGELSHDAARQVLVCPWHGFEFDLATGREVCWRRPASLRMYAIEESSGDVVIAL